MRLERFALSKYRSIIKSDRLPLGDLTVLVGPNNEGKSNLIQGLVTGMQELATRPARRPLRRRNREAGRYDWDADFPQSLQEAQPNGKTIMNFDFALTEEEVDDFEKAIGSRLNGLLPIQLSFNPARTYFSVRKQRHSAALSAKQDQIADFVADRVAVQYIPAVRNAGTAADIVRSMVRKELAAAYEKPEYAAALEQLHRLQQPTLEALSRAISTKMQELLPDVSGIELIPDERGPGIMGPVRIVVDDGNATDLEFKGDGVQSLAALSIIQHYSTQTARAKEFILAVEEPESHLHPKAIHALRSVLRDTASKQQVLLTTHSPLFVNRFEVGSNIIVERNRAQPASSVKELREVLGVRTADNLEHAEVILVVEGPTDEIALKALLSCRSERLKAAFEESTLAIYPLRGGGSLSYALTLLRDSLAAVHAFLDADQQGVTAGEKAEQEDLLDSADRTLAMFPGAKESELEDLLDPMVYSDAFTDRFGVNVSHPWVNKMSEGKWSKRLPTVVKASGEIWKDARLGEFKQTVAEAVAENPEHALKVKGVPVLEALETALQNKLDLRKSS
jgi:putative ATP-dependent endonuclease of OLD family